MNINEMELNAEDLARAAGGHGEKMMFMVIKDGEKSVGPFETEAEAKEQARKLGEGWKVVPVWGF